MSRILCVKRALSPFRRRFERIEWADLARQTLVCSALVGVGDLLAQLYQGGGEREKIDSSRLCHMTLAGAFLGPWFKERRLHINRLKYISLSLVFRIDAFQWVF